MNWYKNFRYNSKNKKHMSEKGRIPHEPKVRRNPLKTYKKIEIQSQKRQYVNAFVSQNHPKKWIGVQIRLDKLKWVPALLAGTKTDIK